MKRWYVYDNTICFAGYDTVQEAAERADKLEKSGIVGIHIVHMSHPEAVKYCETGTLNKDSWNSK